MAVERIRDFLLSHELVRFLFVGGCATVSHFLILIGLVELAGASPVAASAAGYFCSAGLSYVLNRSFTFRSNAAHLTAAPRFAAMVASGLTLNTVLFAGFHALFGHYLLAQVVTTFFVVVFNYTVASRWVFPDATRQMGEEA